MVTSQQTPQQPESQPDRWCIISQKVNENALSNLFENLRAYQIEFVAIKGWSIARFYPESHIRTYTDIDIAVNSKDLNEFESLRSKLPRISVGIDVHSELRDRDTVPWDDIFVNTYIVELNGVPIRVLSDEDNLRVTAAHWLIDGGVYKDRLWDIFYLVEKRKPDFDWERCLKAGGPVRESWVTAAIVTARDYLGLRIDDLPQSVRDFRLPKWYKRSLQREWERGPYLRYPLWMCLGRPGVLFQQLRRRFPPNPIAATTDTEGPIDDSSRLKYQFRSIIKKIRPFILGVGRRMGVSEK